MAAMQMAAAELVTWVQSQLLLTTAEAPLAQLLLPSSSCPAPLAQLLFPISACPQADDPDEDKYLDPCAYFMGMYNDAAKRDSLATEFRAVIQMMAPHGGVGPIQTVAPSTDSNA